MAQAILIPMDLRLVDFLAQCQEEEQEAVERWFTAFQLMLLSPLGTVADTKVFSDSTDSKNRK